MQGVNSINAKLRFTTPSLNEQAVQGDAGTGGVIINKELDGHEYNFVGFERIQTTGGGNNTVISDYDFNDALLCIETSLRPKNDIPVDPVETGIITKGYYLFEDLNGAGRNDNDFNDLVLFYEKNIHNISTDPEQGVAGSTPFLWMKEGVLITEGYENFNANYGWYAAPSNREVVVPRAAGETQY